MSLLLVYKNRGITRDIVVKDIDGNAITLVASDKIRAVIGHVGKLTSDLSTAEFTVVSGTDSVAGSSFTKNSPLATVNRLRLDASDLDFEPGAYTMFIDMLDGPDASEWKNVDRFTFYLEGTE